MADPRFLLACGSGSTAAAWWVRGTVTGLSANDCWYAWRLTGANNRELGRGAAVYPTVPACLEAAARVMREATRAEVEVGTDPLTRLWSWKLRLRGGTVAVSGRQYQRHRECLYNLDRFLAAAPVALLCPEPVPVRRAAEGTCPPLLAGLA